MVVTPDNSVFPIAWTGARRPRRSRPLIGLAPASTQAGGGASSGNVSNACSPQGLSDGSDYATGGEARVDVPLKVGTPSSGPSETLRKPATKPSNPANDLLTLSG